MILSAISRGRVNLAALAVVVLSGCDDAPPATRSCDPLQEMTTPVVLGKVLGVGSDAAGTIYLVDLAPTGERLFVSQGTVLVRQSVGGSGSTSDATGTLVVLTGRDAASPLAVEIQQDAAGQPRAMGIYRGTLAAKTFEIGSMGEVLQLLPTTAVSGLALQNLPGTVSIQHLATLSDGRELMVTRPDVDATYDDVRVFFGTPPTLVERRVTPTAQPMSFTQLTFDLDGRQAVATFPSQLNTGVTAMLAVGSDVFPLVEAALSTPPTASAFLCL